MPLIRIIILRIYSVSFNRKVSILQKRGNKFLLLFQYGDWRVALNIYMKLKNFQNVFKFFYKVLAQDSYWDVSRHSCQLAGCVWNQLQHKRSTNPMADILLSW